jgi:monoterpene epsilon-lactone hydrolase
MGSSDPATRCYLIGKNAGSGRGGIMGAMSAPSDDQIRRSGVLPFRPPTDVDLKHLRAFAEVAEGLNFSRAAERLYISAPALSRQIQSLERAVGCRLFQRSTHQVELTLAGKALLDSAHLVLDTLERGIAATRAVGGQLDARMSGLWEPVAEARDLGDISTQRLALEAMMAQFPPPPELSVMPVNAGGVPSLRLSPPAVPDDTTMLYLHGGGFVMGSAFGYRATVAALTARTRTAAVVPDYRLAPEHPFPAALEDALAAYRWLLGTGVRPSRLIVAGDSAGAALAVLLLVRLVSEDLPRPAMGLLQCPWLNLRHNALTDRPDLAAGSGLTADHLHDYVESYADGHPLDDPRISPLHSDLTGLPPLLVQAGTGDPLRDDARRLVDRAVGYGVDARLEMYTADTHNFPLFWSFLPEAMEAMRRAGERVDAVVRVIPRRRTDASA